MSNVIFSTGQFGLSFARSIDDKSIGPGMLLELIGALGYYGYDAHIQTKDGVLHDIRGLYLSNRKVTITEIAAFDKEDSQPRFFQLDQCETIELSFIGVVFQNTLGQCIITRKPTNDGWSVTLLMSNPYEINDERAIKFFDYDNKVRCTEEYAARVSEYLENLTNTHVRKTNQTEEGFTCVIKTQFGMDIAYANMPSGDHAGSYGEPTLPSLSMVTIHPMVTRWSHTPLDEVFREWTLTTVIHT